MLFLLLLATLALTCVCRQYSLALALEELGYPTLHTMHLYENEDLLGMWDDMVVQPSIKAGKSTLGAPDLELLAAHGYRATADFPMALYYEQVHKLYPDCKFVLTVREDSEVWFRSWDTLTKSIAQPTRYAGSYIGGVKKCGDYMRWLFSFVGKDSTILTTPFPLPDQNKEHAIASYEAHNKKVRETIPEHLLLEYNVKQGWKPLCNFLDVQSCPKKPFPKTNSARSVQVHAITGFVFPLALVMFVGCYLFVAVFQRATGRTVLDWLHVRVSQLLTPKLSKRA